MSDTTAILSGKIDGARDLKSVVQTMKALAASSVGQYERSVRALGDYYLTVERGLSACLRAGRNAASSLPHAARTDTATIGAIVFGSDQGLVGRFNEVMADYVIETLAELPGKPKVWVIGTRVAARLMDAGLPSEGLFPVPNSVESVASLVDRIQVESEAYRVSGSYTDVYVFYNRSQSGSSYEPTSQRLLPLDAAWEASLVRLAWPTQQLPEVIGDSTTTLRALLHEYLFISLFRACAESLASENASRLAAMQRAEKNIDELLTDLNGRFHHLRQSGIDEELFDVISGFEMLRKKPRSGAKPTRSDMR